MSDKVKIIPLGGQAEMGKNLYVIHINEKIFIVDAGFRFPESDKLGVDIIIPSFDYLKERQDQIEGIFITHGHGYGVKSSCDPLVKAALAQGADVALFGHTHEALSTQRDGIFLVNPGSVSRARQGGESYAVIDLLEHTLVVSIAPYPPGSLRKPY